MNNPLGVGPSKPWSPLLALIPFTWANAQLVIHGFTLIYTSELILYSTICVHSATLQNVNMYP